MKFTIQELKNIINEELNNILEQSDVEDHDGDGETGQGFPSDVPFIDYEEAKDDTEAGILPQLRQAADNRPVYFLTKIKEKYFRSVYTKYKPGIEDARRYQKMGVRLIWADSRYGIGNWSPRSIIGIQRTISRERDYAMKTGGSYHYGYDESKQIDEIIDEEINMFEAEMDKDMVISLEDRLQILIGDKRVDLKYDTLGAMGRMMKPYFADKPDGYTLTQADEGFLADLGLPRGFEKLAGLRVVRRS